MESIERGMALLMADARLASIFRVLKTGGFDAYVVGGALRDMAMGIHPQDIDVVTDAAVEDIRELFGARAVQTFGRAFEICLVDGIQISSCRAKKNFPAGDLGRRDFTFNSMAWHPFSNTLLDLFSGGNDLGNRVVRFTGDPDARIAEDPLRMVRACRFAAAVRGRLATRTSMAIIRHAPLLKTTVARERIRMEILKAMHSEKPSLFFQTLHRTGLLSDIFPSLERCVGFDGGPHHGETVFEHCMLTGDALAGKQTLLRLAGFLHDVGKVDAAAWDQGKLTFAGHEKYTDEVEKELETLRFSAPEIRYMLSLLRVHMRPLKSQTTPRAARRILAMLRDHDISYRDFLRMRIADKRANLAKQPYTFSQIRERLEILLREMKPDRAFRIKDLAVNGNDVIQLLGIESGPLVGQILCDLFKQVIDRPELNTRDRLKKWISDVYQTNGEMTVENSSE